MATPSSQKPMLPVDAVIPRIHAALAAGNALILQAAPGTGKTTRVPPALLHAPYLDPRKEILVLEPRRLAAKMSARRVAQELGEGVGQTVGYQFRFENMTGPRTRVRFITEGMLMRRLITDPRLAAVSAVILDEFHERHLHSDVSLAFLKHLHETDRPDLRVIVMSATLDSESLAQYLGTAGAPAPIVRIDARQYDVAVEYLPHPPVRHLDQTVKEGMAHVLATAMAKTPGDILVFLPGMGEIRRAAQALEPLSRKHGLRIHALHGELSKEEQDEAIRPDKSARKVILSTNVAETSLTIEGVTVVIDSGLHRMASHSWWSGVPALKTKATSRASAIQRAGRAGRMQPGHCLRLYTRGDFDARPMFETPEIGRADLTQTLLELRALGVEDPSEFPWFERPQPQALEASRALLYRLGALDSAEARSRLTPLGRRMAQLPAHPRISRMLLEAERADVLEDAASLAAYIMESRLEGASGHDALAAIQFLHKARMEESVWRVRSHLMSAFERKRGDALPRPVAAPPHARPKEDRLRFAILCGYPDRVARKRPGQDPNAAQFDLVLSAGGSARLENTAAVSGSDTFVILDLQERQHHGQARSSTQVQSLCPIEADWLLDLEPSAVQDVEEPVWDEARKRVLLASRLTYDQLVLSESRVDLRADSPQAAQAARVLLKEALGLDAAKLVAASAHDIVQALAPVTEPADLEALLARIALVARSFPEHALPDATATGVTGPLIARLLEGKSSLAELKQIDWETELLAACGELRSHQLNELVPTQVQLNSGRKTRVNYGFAQAPWIESRLQDFFGMKKGPSILKGRVPLTLHLLAPNGRAVQVTTDLEGFWQRAYPELRHPLSRRYPRHSWPEDV